MSKRIDHIIEVLEHIRNEYAGSSNISSLRLKATQEVAYLNGLIRNTILDTITRQLEPEIRTVEKFDNLVFDWLNNSSSDLKNILLNHCVTEKDKSKVNLFFSLNSFDLLLNNDLGVSLDELYTEGGKKLLLHYVRERNKFLVKKAKEYWSKKYGHAGINCEICKFNFVQTYGDLGLGFIEAHHNKPISEIDTKTNIKIKDLSPLCSNCHRMIHNKRPWLTVGDLKKIITETKN